MAGDTAEVYLRDTSMYFYELCSVDGCDILRNSDDSMPSRRVADAVLVSHQAAFS